jgi:hypothetical protein
VRSVTHASAAAASTRNTHARRATGYHVRVWAQYAFDRASGGPSPRSVWGSLDDDTVVVIVSAVCLVCCCAGAGAEGR